MDASFHDAARMILHSRTRSLDLSSHVGIVAVVNVTPDSSVDGGKYTTESAVKKRAEECIAQGADIIEIGGESTGPGSCDVTEEEELSRILPAIDVVRSLLPDTWISVDTWKSVVAHAALEAGADSINDVTAGRGDNAMFRVLADVACPCVLMYSKDPTARTTKESKQYDDMMGTITAFLQDRVGIAIKAGIKKERIIIDPGLGHFVSSDPTYSFQILARLADFTTIAPVMVSPSRKSFLAGALHHPPSQRLAATLAATSVAALNGASFVRTHDVQETYDTLEVVRAVMRFN